MPLLVLALAAAFPQKVLAEDLSVTSKAETPLTANISTYTIDMNDQKPLDTLKQEVIKKYVESVSSADLEDIDVEKSVIAADGFDRTKSGLQTVSLSLSIITKKESSEVSKHYAETAFVELAETGPRLVLNAEEVTVDLGSTFDYASNVGYISSRDGVLPVIRETDNVDVNQEGTYQCTIEAVDAKGKTAEASFRVVVKKPAEVIRAEEEARIAAEKAAAEAAARAAAEAEAARVRAAAAQAAQTAAAAAAVSAPVNPTGSSIADYALQFVGSPYVYGGSSPSGFDCSGFTSYVYSHFGISLARSSSGQQNAGTIIPVSQAQPGDLVTYNGHAAIYIGGGRIVNAMTPSQGVAVCSMYDITNGNMKVHRF